MVQPSYVVYFLVFQVKKFEFYARAEHEFKH